MWQYHHCWGLAVSSSAVALLRSVLCVGKFFFSPLTVRGAGDLGLLVQLFSCSAVLPLLWPSASLGGLRIENGAVQRAGGAPLRALPGSPPQFEAGAQMRLLVVLVGGRCWCGELVEFRTAVLAAMHVSRICGFGW